MGFLWKKWKQRFVQTRKIKSAQVNNSDDWIPDIERDGDDCVEDDDVREEDEEGDGGGPFLHIARFVCRSRNKALPGEINCEFGADQCFPYTTGHGHGYAHNKQQNKYLSKEAENRLKNKIKKHLLNHKFHFLYWKITGLGGKFNFSSLNFFSLS